MKRAEVVRTFFTEHRQTVLMPFVYHMGKLMSSKKMGPWTFEALPQISVLSVAFESSDHRRHQYLWGCERFKISSTTRRGFPRTRPFGGSVHRNLGSGGAVDLALAELRDRDDRRGKGLSDEMVGGGKVTSVNRGLVPTRSGLRRAKTGPRCGQWRDGAALTRIAVAFGAGQM